MNIQLPEDVRYIIHTLQDAGHEAFAVGGCVRDSLLSRTPDDWDITTSARPEETKALFRRTIKRVMRSPLTGWMGNMRTEGIQKR